MERRPTDYLSQSHEKNPTSLSAAQSDVEKTMDSVQSANSTVESTRSGHVLRSNPQPFIGRLGGNQEFVLDRSDAANAPILKELPDAAPYMSMREQFDLRPFRSPGLWKAAIVEGVGKFYLCWVGSLRLLTLLVSISRLVLACLCHGLDQFVSSSNTATADATDGELRQCSFYRSPSRRNYELVVNHSFYIHIWRGHRGSS